MNIKPTLGRIVHYRGDDGEFRAAIISGVNGDFNVNLYVFPTSHADTDCGSKMNVTHADPEQEPLCFPSWGWMPYQVEQATKAEDREHDAKQLAVAESCAIETSGLRAHAIDMALRTPGLDGQQDVIDAASAYMEFIKTGGLGVSAS